VLHDAFAQHPRVVEAAGKGKQQQGKSGPKDLKGGALVNLRTRGKDANNKGVIKGATFATALKGGDE
jgi:hypothetical protein